MRKLFITTILMSFLSSAYAERVIDTVHSVSKGLGQEDHLVFLENGRVLFFNSTNEIPKIGTKIEVELDEDQEVKSLMTLPQDSYQDETFIEEAPVSPMATVLDSYERANTIFQGMNRRYRNKSECTDRAHVWTYEEWKKRSLVSKKVFLFFTDTYIRRYNYHWWFHVSPYTFVRNGSGTTEYVMDRRYSKNPLTMKNWTDIFIRSKRDCPASTYRHFRANRNGSSHCYAVRSSMYNRLPYHVRQEEDNGRTQTGFSSSEVNFSYRAFY